MTRFKITLWGMLVCILSLPASASDGEFEFSDAGKRLRQEAAQDQVEDLKQQRMEVLPYGVASDQQDAYIQFLRRLEPELEGRVLDVVRPFEFKNLRPLAEILHQTPVAQILPRLQLAALYTLPKKDPAIFTGLVRAFSSIPENDSVTLNLALRMSDPGSSQQLLKMIEVLRSVGTDSAQEWVMRVLSVQDEFEWNLLDCHSILVSFLSMDLEFREHAWQMARDFIETSNRAWTGDLLGQVVQILMNLYSSQLEPFKPIVRLMANTFGPALNLLPDLLQQLSRLEMSQFQTTVNRIRKFMNQFKFRHIGDIMELCQAIQEVRPGEEESVFGALDLINFTWKSFRKVDMMWRGHNQVKALRAIAHADRRYRYEILEMIKEFQDIDEIDLEALDAYLLASTYIPWLQGEFFFLGAFAYLGYLIESYEIDMLNDTEDELVQGILGRYAIYVTSESKLWGQDHLLPDLLAHWREVLLGKDIQRALILSQVISKNYDEMGLHQEHPRFLEAIRVGALLDPNPLRNPCMIHQELMKKKQVSVEWGGLDSKSVVSGAIKMRLNHRGIPEFCRSMQLDLDSVPNFTVQNFKALLKELKGSYNKKKNKVTKYIEDDLVEDSFKIRLLLADKRDMMANKFRCVLHWIKNHPSKEDRLKRMENLVCATRKCKVGQNDSIESWYQGLPVEYKIRSQLGSLNYSVSELPVRRLLLSAIQSAVRTETSDAGPLIQLYGAPLDDDEEKIYDDQIYQASHQMLYLRNLIGDLIGFSDSVRYDKDSQCVEDMLLESTMQEALEDYYEMMNFEEFMARVLIHFNGGYYRDKGIYNGLEEIHLLLKSRDHPIEGLEEWIEMVYESDDDYIGKVAGITKLGLMRVMQHMGILEEFPGL